jgi:uncharacterized membrane protein
VERHTCSFGLVRDIYSFVFVVNLIHADICPLSLFLVCVTLTVIIRGFVGLGVLIAAIGVIIIVLILINMKRNKRNKKQQQPQQIEKQRMIEHERKGTAVIENEMMMTPQLLTTTVTTTYRSRISIIYSPLFTFIGHTQNTHTL